MKLKVGQKLTYDEMREIEKQNSPRDHGCVIYSFVTFWIWILKDDGWTEFIKCSRNEIYHYLIDENLLTSDASSIHLGISGSRWVSNEDGWTPLNVWHVDDSFDGYIIIVEDNYLAIGQL